MKTINNFHFFYKIPILRLDFNVPQNSLLKVLDTIYKIIISNRVQKTIFISHLRNTHRETSNKFSIIQFIQKALKHIVIYGKKPITAIIGVTKISSKINIIENILLLIDQGRIGYSIVEDYKKTFVFEITNFSYCILSIINLKGAFFMVGNRDSILSKKKYKNKISYISTEVGVMLDILKGKLFIE